MRRWLFSLQDIDKFLLHIGEPSSLNPASLVPSVQPCKTVLVVVSASAEYAAGIKYMKRRSMKKSGNVLSELSLYIMKLIPVLKSTNEKRHGNYDNQSFLMITVNAVATESMI